MSDPVFHSKDIADTKAKEKRKVFVKVEEKKTLKQSAEEFQKKFAEAKAHAAESRAKIENPGVDANGLVTSHVKKPIAKIILITLIIAAVVAGGIFIYSELTKGGSRTKYRVDETNTSCQKVAEIRANYDAVVDEFGTRSEEALKADAEYLTIVHMCHEKIEYSDETFTEEVNQRLYGEEQDEGEY